MASSQVDQQKGAVLEVVKRPSADPPQQLMLSPTDLQCLTRLTGNSSAFHIPRLNTQGYFNKRTNNGRANVRNQSVPLTPITYEALEPLRAQYAARASFKAAGIAHHRAYDQWALQFPFDPGITLHTCSDNVDSEGLQQRHLYWP
jgi:hypothetical protein